MAEQEVVKEKGEISIHSENIFPIIKKFLYADQEVFLRELIANATDASLKMKKLSSLGKYKGEVGDLTITVDINKAGKRITFSDHGIGMTAEEVKRYINQIAFSGATEFAKKYVKKNHDLIGHFGLGFYAAFMVAKQVDIITRSYQRQAHAVQWSCQGDTAFEMTKTVKKERGTDVILHIQEDSEEFLEKERIQTLLQKYCKFLPIPIRFDGKVINEATPIWTKKPSELDDKAYIKFYKTLYPYSEDPLFWVHLNVDYPFTLTGVLYFQKLQREMQIEERKAQLYSRQMFITDDVTNIMPNFLRLLHGVIDSPDIPLNVSRSYLQMDSNVKRISNHITKKVAEKLVEFFKEKRADYEKKWRHIGLFAKYGVMNDEKFAEKVQEIILLSDTEQTHYTVEEHKKKIAATQTNKDEKVVFLYTQRPKEQDFFVQAAKDNGYTVLVMSDFTDIHFINYLEAKYEDIQWKQVDADTADKLIDKGEEKHSLRTKEEEDIIKKCFEEAITSREHSIKTVGISTEAMPVQVVMPEAMRRMQDMSAASQGVVNPNIFASPYEVVVNVNHPVMDNLLNKREAAAQRALARQLYDMALLSQNMLSGEALTSFIQRNLSFLTTPKGRPKTKK